MSSCHHPLSKPPMMMVIEKGKDWGRPANAEDQATAVVDSDAEAAALAFQHRNALKPLTLSLAGGDLARTLGLGGSPTLRPTPDADQMVFPIDLGLVRLDDSLEPLPFTAHVIARRTGWNGPFAVVMNAGWFGDWYLGPRAHPNDGLLDITSGALTFQQRLLARRRVSVGTHLPHPSLKMVRRPEWKVAFDTRTSIWVDGQRVGRVTKLKVQSLPDCFSVLVPASR